MLSKRCQAARISGRGEVGKEDRQEEGGIEAKGGGVTEEDDEEQ